MMLDNVKVYRYDLRLKDPLILAGVEHRTRSGLLLKITNKDAVFGLGEIAPLPGFSEETLDMATKKLFEFLDEYKTKHLGNIGEVSKNLLPSVAFGIETALISLMANSKGLSFSGLVYRDAPGAIALNGLLWGNKEIILQQAQKLNEAGYRTFKLKIGRQSFDDDIKLIEEIIKIIGVKGQLRLDANQAYGYDTASRLLEYAFKKNIEYVEEPFSDFDELKKYLGGGDHAQLIALDESLRRVKTESCLGQLPHYEKAGAMILKPTMTGYIESMAFAMAGIKKNLKVIISSSFESALGLYHLASVAAVVNSDKFDYAAGLDTFGWFEENLFDISKYITNDIFDLKKAVEIYNNIDWSKLNEVEHA